MNIGAPFLGLRMSRGLWLFAAAVAIVCMAVSAALLPGEAQAAKLCCGVFPPKGERIGVEGEKFGVIEEPVGVNTRIDSIAGVAVNEAGAGPGASPGDFYVVDKANNRIQQFSQLPDEEGHRFIRVFGKDVGGAGVDVCESRSACQAGAASGEAGAMNEPVGVAIDQQSGALYVTDNRNHRVDVFSADGTFEGAFGWHVDATTPAEELQYCTALTGCQEGSIGGGAGQFPAATGNTKIPSIRGLGYPAVAPQGAPNARNVVIADSNNNRVDEFTPTFNPSGEVTAVTFARAFGWGVATGASELQRCGPDAAPPTATCQAGLEGGGAGQFTTRGLTRVAVDGQGNTFTVDLPDTGGGCNAVTTSDSRHCRVLRFNPAATEASEFGAGELNFTGGGAKKFVAATDIAADPATGEVYALRPSGDLSTVSPEIELLHFSLAGALLDRTGVGAFTGLSHDDAGVSGLALDSASGRVYVTSRDEGPHIRILTDPPPIPALAVTGTSSDGASFALRRLAGIVNPEGFRVLGCFFEYGTTTAYGSTTPCEPGPEELGEGTADADVSAETEPLEPNTTYHYRLVVENGGPLGLGEDRTFTTGSAPDSGCPNEARRREQGVAALLLPGCMALEMASPVQKFGQFARTLGVSADGERVSFNSAAALGASVLNLGGNVYVASRGPTGWQTEPTVPAQPIARLWESAEARPSLNPDFSRWFQVGATAGQFQTATSRAFEGGLGGLLTPLSDTMTPIAGSTDTQNTLRSGNLQGASADRSHLYFRPGGGTRYLPTDPQLSGTGAEKGNTYLIGPRGVELLEYDKDGKLWGGNCGARLGGIGRFSGPAPNGERNQGAVSADGTRTYLSARASQPQSGACEASSKLRILERLETPSGPLIRQLFGSECTRDSPPCAGADGDDLYQGASADGSKVYFTTNRQLADSDLDGTAEECSTEEGVAGCDLYLYDRSRPLGERLTQVSAGEDVGGEHETGKEADVYNGITAISGDGSHAYFVAAGVLTADPSPSGESAREEEPNLYMWEAETEQTSFVGTLADADSIAGDLRGGGLWGGQGSWRNRAYPVPVGGRNAKGEEVGGDGHVLFFQSNAELMPEDADGEHLDVYRYDGSSLECISCKPGGPDSAPVDVLSASEPAAAGTDFAEEGRWASEDGQSAGFTTPKGLVPGDVNGEPSYYLWRNGSLFRLPGRVLLSGGGGAKPLRHPFLSHDGSSVAFTTSTALLPSDKDTSADVYVARIGGGFPFAAGATPCELPDGCQAPRAAPSAPSTGSETPGPGNPKQIADPCARPARKAQILNRRARRLARNARRVNRRNHRRAVQMRRKSNRLARQAKRQSNVAKRCRTRRRANTDGGTGR